METPPVSGSPSSVSGSNVPPISTSSKATSLNITRPREVGEMPSGDRAQRQIDKNAGALKSGLREIGGKIVEVFSKLPMKYLVMTACAGFVLAMVVPVVLLLSTLLSGGGALVVVGLYVAMLVLAGSALVASVGASFMILELVTGVGNADGKSQQRDLEDDPAPVGNPIDETQRALAHREAMEGSGFESKPPLKPEGTPAEGEKLDPPVSSPKPERPRLKRSLSFSNNNPKAKKTLKGSTSIPNLMSQNIPKAAIPSPSAPDKTISPVAAGNVANATAKVAEKTIEAMQKEIEVFTAVFTEELQQPIENPASPDAAPAPTPLNQGHEVVTEVVRAVLQVEQAESSKPSQVPTEPPPVQKQDISEPPPVLAASSQATAEQTAKTPVIKVRGVDILQHLNSHTGPLLREYLEAQYNKSYIFPNKFRPLENIRVKAEGSDYNLAQFAQHLTITEKRGLADHLHAHYSNDLNKKIA